MELTELPEEELPPWEYGRLGDFFLKRAEEALGGAVIPNAPKIKFMDSAVLYERAAECFRIAHMWQDAGEALGRCADLQLSIGNKPKSVVYASLAGEVAERLNPVEAVIYYRNAIAVSASLQDYKTAAALQFQIAELLDDDHNYEEAIDAYRLASDYFIDDHDTEAADLCLEKCAYLLAYVKRFREAAKVWLKLSERCMEHNLLRFNSHTFLLKSGLCHLANDDVPTLKRKLVQFRKVDFSFMNSRENKFLSRLVEFYMANDLIAFAHDCFDFDCVSPLDYISLRMLRKVRERIKNNGELKDDFKQVTKAIAEDRNEKRKFQRTMTSLQEQDKWKLEYDPEDEMKAAERDAEIT
mmetsp:Transcript_9789/g.28746  ORF Transcript_9789/g.28746 Transcript_9789/m.28746 type:complete len:354 (-) Transcript_9789:1900-2961(-)